MVDNPKMKYFFGKVTMYKWFNQEAQEPDTFFSSKVFSRPDELVRPKNPLELNMDVPRLKKIFNGKITRRITKTFKLCKEPFRSNPASYQCLHEPFTFYEGIWNSNK
jgi:hypothetical protein